MRSSPRSAAAAAEAETFGSAEGERLKRDGDGSTLVPEGARTSKSKKGIM
jgi:hypothetical protein